MASNLGTVELTVALHRVFDCPDDQIVWDVGHQCYTHKLLTGRREQFSTLRQEGGLSGFPKRKESEYDAFIAGHSSTSISVASGLARAKKLQNDQHHVIAVIGDGAFTSGLAFEGANNAARFGDNLIVISQRQQNVHLEKRRFLFQVPFLKSAPVRHIFAPRTGWSQSATTCR